jgi:hypothetical protein
MCAIQLWNALFFIYQKVKFGPGKVTPPVILATQEAEIGGLWPAPGG